MPLHRLRMYFRRRMPHMEQSTAYRFRNRFAFLYAAIGWNVLGFSVYYLFYKSVPKNEDSVDYAKLLGVKEASVVKFSGFHKVADYKITLEDKDIDEYLSQKKREEAALPENQTVANESKTTDIST